MAKIEIEKKTPKWPWIILVLVVISVLIYIFAFNDDDESDDMQNQTTEESTGNRQESLNNSTVITYVSFMEDHSDDMGIDHEFTNEALLKLTNATNAMADEMSYDIKKDIDRAKTLLEKITQEPFETSHANSIKEAAGVLSQSLQNIQQNAFPDLTGEADEVKMAVAGIETDELTLDQKENVKNFFRKSADLLEKMNNNSPQN
ncbi:hypothetical protein [Marivirga sp.]|uniref:hypothetical protein n=1 Tax=Marivirga sp. TaxID=2018662 RepID=UPI002D7FB963|nr:hypothetical protein [Marivirga sp.]HET8860493.1 hypothetical protein [Marivirga sp.]